MATDLQGTLDKFRDHEGLYQTEGERGVNNLEKVLAALGYDSRYSTSVLHSFLTDNSGAVEALLQWVGEQRSQEWRDMLVERMGGEDSDEEDDDEETE